MKLQPARILSSAADSRVGIFNPRKALINLHLRSALYAATKSPRTIGDWNPIDGKINDIIGNSATPVRSRVRQLVKDFSYFAKANRVICDYPYQEMQL